MGDGRKPLCLVEGAGLEIDDGGVAPGSVVKPRPTVGAVGTRDSSATCRRPLPELGLALAEMEALFGDRHR